MKKMLAIMNLGDHLHDNYLGARHDRKKVPRKMRKDIDHSDPNHVCSPHHVRIPAHCRLKKVRKKKLPKDTKETSENIPETTEFETFRAGSMLAINSNQYF